jgi:hypothetical protein
MPIVNDLVVIGRYRYNDHRYGRCGYDDGLATEHHDGSIFLVREFSKKNTP